MGGENESTLKPEAKAQSQSTLQPDVREETVSMAEVVKRKKKKDKKKKHREPPLQMQALRQHVSGGECHWHDDARKLKFAMPVADYYVIKRELLKLEMVERADTVNKTVIRFEPYVKDGVADLAITVEPLKFAARFELLLSLVK